MFCSPAIKIFKIRPPTSMKVSSEDIIATDMRKVNKFGKSCRLRVALEQDFKCSIHKSNVKRNQTKPLSIFKVKP